MFIKFLYTNIRIA